MKWNRGMKWLCNYMIEYLKLFCEWYTSQDFDTAVITIYQLA